MLIGKGIFRNVVWIHLLLTVMALGCQTGEDEPPTNERAVPPTPQEAFTALEDRLTSASGIEVDFEVTAEGALEASVQGTLVVHTSMGTRLNATGTFMGTEFEVLLEIEDGMMMYGTPSMMTGEPLPEALNEALLIGFTRMGILHNLARLVAGSPPDHAEGGVRDWVMVDGFRSTNEDDTVGFDLTVADTPSGSATLSIARGGQPMLRTQTVVFGTDEMRVTERYTRFSLVREN